ncbi:MAG: DUF1444 family protein [Chloroflexi bacterium]|nr:DUF1444 family protein [Chloroflexota bacterium]
MSELVWSPVEFTQAAAQVLAAAPEVEIISLGDLTLTLRVRGREVVGDLESFFNAYQSAPERVEEVWLALTEALLDQPVDRSEDDLERLLDRVMPMLKPLTLLSELRAQKLPLVVYRPLVGDLMVTYVIDEGQSVVYLNEDHLAKWGVTEPTLHWQALQNLREKSWKPYPGMIGSGKGALLILNGTDGYDATRLLLTELFADFVARMPGNTVFGVPNRDFLIAFSDADPRVFSQVRAQIEVDAQTQSHPLTDQLLTLVDGQLQLYTPDA